MATIEERNAALKAAKENIAKLSATDPKKLARTSDLAPTINFEKAVPYFEEMIDLFKQLNQRDISSLPTGQLNRIIEAGNFLSRQIMAVHTFDLDQNTPGTACRKIIKIIESEYDEVKELLLLPLAFTATQATDYAKIEREAKGFYATIKEETKNHTEFMENVHSEAENALEAVKAQAAEAGVSTNAQIFISDAEKHEAQAKKWFWATIFTTVVTLVVAAGALIAAFFYHPEGIPSTIQYLVSKLFVISIMSFGIFWCARNYKSQKHNETLNRHRANALKTFRAFVEGTSDARVKDAILLQAAQAAFSSRPTGFDSPEKDPQAINPVVEILGKTLQQTNGGT